MRTRKVGDIGWVVHRQGQPYAEESGYDGSSEALVAEIAVRFVRKFDATGKRCWVAEQDGRILGAVFVVRKSAATTHFRLLCVGPSARGQGLGGRLVDECIRFARAKRYRNLTLWTQSHVDAAGANHRSRGFRLNKEEHHRSFGNSLVGEHWLLML